MLARAKSNIGTDEGGVSYTIEPCTIPGEIETTHVAWGDLIEGSAREILGDVEGSDDDTRMDDDDPSEALKRILKDGPMTGKQVKSLMAENGYSAKQTRTAREKLSVVTAREGFGKEIKTLWSLPQATGPYSLFPPLVPLCPDSCPALDMGTNGEKGHEWEKSGDGAPMPSFAEDDAEEV